MIPYQSYLKTPSGNIFRLDRIGGLKAIDAGLLLLGRAETELLEFLKCPLAVAKAWQAALGDLLTDQRHGKTPATPNWAALATKADPDWARQNGFAAPAAVQKA